MPEKTAGAARTAHRRSVEISDADVVEAMGAKLGNRLVAFIVDKDPSTISRWRANRNSPDEDSIKKLRLAYQIFQLLEHAESDPTIRAWFIGMNPQLDDLSPAEALNQGLHREAMAAARAFLTGG